MPREIPIPAGAEGSALLAGVKPLPERRVYPKNLVLELGESVNVITIERDLWEDVNAGNFPLSTNLSDLEPHKKRFPRYPPTDFSDRIRYNEYEARMEQEYYDVVRLPESKQTIVDNFDTANETCREMIEEIDNLDFWNISDNCSQILTT